MAQGSPPLPRLLLDNPCPLETQLLPTWCSVSIFLPPHLFFPSGSSSSHAPVDCRCPVTPPESSTRLALTRSRVLPMLFNQILPLRAGAPQPCLLLSPYLRRGRLLLTPGAVGPCARAPVPGQDSGRDAQHLFSPQLLRAGTRLEMATPFLARQKPQIL
ncbi:hypothetical protein N657DRAFT_238692 [Parathielavia appendiculata]|uniref:Uncharacterized protein n=1 Tax=Parathielavia appendiculata TaxID=2587402 RepID=A0AAN6TT42_9PEZI|nr:hypothetical protein N657DRAFT_238692 [Parathielavia appendiculata]